MSAERAGEDEPAMTSQRVALITGTLAAPATRRVADDVRQRFGVDVEVVVLNIQVAALMTAEWVERKLTLPEGQAFDRVIVPGYLRGDLDVLQARLGVSVERGPHDVYDLPTTFGGRRQDVTNYGEHDIRIIAEINHASRMTTAAIVAEALAMQADGADVIDVGCDPQADREPWLGVAEVVRALRDAGCRVSIDTFHPAEIEAACAAGAEMVLSVNSVNLAECVAAKGWGATVVAIPDDIRTLGGLDASMAALGEAGVSFCVDPILEPIGFGFAASLQRYFDVRRRYPDVDMMMGVGNLTEMTAVDSAGVNALLIGICQEVGIGHVLTTQVINWARSSVKEIDLARQLMHYAVVQQTPPKHVDDRLVRLRDARLRARDDATLAELAAGLRDRNYRIFAEAGRLHLMNRDQHVTGDDPFEMFDQLTEPIDASHAFYLGYEMAKAATALTLGKNYTQDESLQWGDLTQKETSHVERKKREQTRGKMREVEHKESGDEAQA